MGLISKSDFAPFFLLRGAHLQTIWAAKFRRKPVTKDIEWEQLELDDGDFLELVWMKNPNRPTVVILPGLEGNFYTSTYVACLMRTLYHQNLQGVLVHSRGCGRKVNRLPRSYHAGDIDDLESAIQFISKKISEFPVAIVGYSLGGNVLLRWLGLTQPNLLQTAVAVSVPFDLSASSDYLSRGFSRCYQKYLLRSMRLKFLEKTKVLGSFLPIKDINSLKSFRHYDDAITAPLHGFSGVEDYYRKTSCIDILPEIDTNTLIIHALDDPFLPPEAVPSIDRLSDSTTLELSNHGGHVGFVGALKNGNLHYWLEDRITSHIHSIL